MTTEIRQFGDNRTIVVYTDNRQIASRLETYKDCFKIVPYEQEQYSKKRDTLVGVDFYFPKRIMRRLERFIARAGDA